MKTVKARKTQHSGKKVRDTAGEYLPARDLPMPKYEYQRPSTRSSKAIDAPAADRRLPSVQNLSFGD